MAEQVVAAGRAGDAAQCFVREAQVFGDEFAVLCRLQLGEGVVVVLFGLVQGAQVAFARDVRAFFAVITTDGMGDGVAQGVDARAGFRRDPQAGVLRLYRGRGLVGFVVGAGCWRAVRRQWRRQGRCRRVVAG